MAHPGHKRDSTKASFWASFWAVLRSASLATYHDNCLEMAKGVAFSSLLSFFPVLTTLAAILVQVKTAEVARTMAGLLSEAVPPGTRDVVRALFVVHGQRPKWLLIAALLLSTFAASGAMMSMMHSFRAVYRIPSGRSFVRERAMAMLLVFVVALPVLGASTLIVFGSRAENMVIGWLGDQGWVLLMGKALRYGAAFGAFVAVTGLVYYIGPNRKQQVRYVVPGAILATLLWLLATLAFGWYVRHIANYNVLYGSVGAGLALLVWMYLLAVIALFGCEFNAACENLRGRRVLR